MFNHVIVPIDCSNDARRDAELLARYIAPLNGAKVTLTANISPSIDPIFKAKKVEHAQAALNAIARIMFAQGIRTRRVIVEGEDAALALANEAYSVDQQYDAFILGPHQTRPEFDELPCRGSFVDQLAQRTHLPLLILPADM